MHKKPAAHSIKQFNVPKT